MGMHIFEGVRTTIFAALGGIGTRVIFGLPGRIGDGMIIFGIFEVGLPGRTSDGRAPLWWPLKQRPQWSVPDAEWGARE